MKIFNKISFLFFWCIVILSVLSCQKTITDFGNTCAISGSIKDEIGNIVPGDIASTGLLVKTLGEGDIVTTDIRVKGDGTFQNTKMYPKKYLIWVVGPVTTVGDTIRLDFSVEKTVVQDIIVIPFITIKKPTVTVDPTATTVDISYEIIAASGKTVSKREVYCSTNPYPNTSTGSGPFYTSIKKTLSTNTGNTSITGLVSNTKYYIRIGAQATGTTGYNFSDQIEITTL